MAGFADYPRLLLEDLTEQDLFEIKHKGWFSALIETLPGHRYLLNFYDTTRLQQEITDAIADQGAPCFAEKGLVVIPEVTPVAIRQCLVHLQDIGYFDSLAEEHRTT